MQIEIHLKRGTTITSFEFPELGKLKVTIQMGQDREVVENHCSKAIEPSILKRVIKIWCDPDHPKEMIESGRDLIIRDCA